jgi:hypothetical protein
MPIESVIRAVSDYRMGDTNSLQDAFSSDDANRLAQLIDAYDDDDFAEVVYAVRAVREAQPDVEPASRKALQETRANLPARLQTMPTRDLSVLSRAFGASRNRPTDATLPYVGQADERRDEALQAYRAGDETALEGTFNRQQEADVMVLANEYPQDDFDAIVRAVRQARTLDPDLEPATVSAVRATRRQLPERLRQIPANDLLGFRVPLVSQLTNRTSAIPVGQAVGRCVAVSLLTVSTTNNPQMLHA